MRAVVRELILFGVLFVVLSLAMHFSAWIEHPIRHLEALPSSPLGLWHPLYLTLAVYLLLGVVRLLVRFCRRLFSGAKRA
ncbi:MAG TPA: hypothetical protein ENK97_01045 [Campylobacteraceae bacterium]|nr:hypothetical protein [Campylobacteraceae bacterium]